MIGFKKVLLSGSILAATSSIAMAGTYVGGSLGVGSGDFSKQAYGGRAFVGYGKVLTSMPRVYLGAEADAALTFHPRGDFNMGLGASVLPGIMLNQYTMVYGRAGVAAPTTARFRNLSPQVGLGVQTSLTSKWDVRGEYTRLTGPKEGIYNVGFVYKLD